MGLKNIWIKFTYPFRKKENKIIKISETSKKIDEIFSVLKDTIEYEKHLRKEQCARLEKRIKEYTLENINALDHRNKIITDKIQERIFFIEEKMESIDKIAERGEKKLGRHVRDFLKELRNMDAVQQTPRRLASIETRVTVLESK